MKINKTIITSIRTTGLFNTTLLTTSESIKQMEQRMKNNIEKSEAKNQKAKTRYLKYHNNPIGK